MAVHVDVNARRQDYQHLTANEVLVTKIFYTLQGEGPLAGHPAVFVRLAGCNLGEKNSCPWCDTYFPLHKGSRLTVSEVTSTAMLAGQDCRLMVLTGGEPMLQNPHLLIENFLARNWRVQIETNGYFWSEEMHKLKRRYGDLLITVISPKVNARKVYPPLDPILIEDSTCLKFLVEDDQDSPYYHPPHYVKWYPHDIYVSPINRYLETPDPNTPVSIWEGPLDHDACRRNHKYAAAIAMRLKYRLSLQTHLYAELE